MKFNRSRREGGKKEEENELLKCLIWMAVIQVNRKCVLLGYYDSKEEAHKTRFEAEIKYFDEYFRFLSRKENIYALTSKTSM